MSKHNPSCRHRSFLTDRLERHNRIFDSTSVRYLYRSGERHDVLPKGDAVVTDINFTREDARSRELEAGVAGSLPGHPIPALTVQATHASKLTYERKLRSWRKSLTYETCNGPQRLILNQANMLRSPAACCPERWAQHTFLPGWHCRTACFPRPRVLLPGVVGAREAMLLSENETMAMSSATLPTEPVRPSCTLDRPNGGTATFVDT